MRKILTVLLAATAVAMLAACGGEVQHDAVKAGNNFIEAGFINVDPVAMSRYATGQALEDIYRDFENDTTEDMAAMRERSVELNIGYRYNDEASEIGDSTALLSYDITVGPQSQTAYAVGLRMEKHDGDWKIAETITVDGAYGD